MMRYFSGIIKATAIIAYVLQLVFLQLLIRLEPYLFAAKPPSTILVFANWISQYMPSIIFASTFLLIAYSLYGSSKAVRTLSLVFLIMMIFEDFLPISYIEQVYASVYWLIFSILIILFPIILLLITAVEKKFLPVLILTVSSLLASSFFIWSFLSRVTFSLPPIYLLPISVYLFVVAFVALAATEVKKASLALYLSIAISLIAIAPITYLTESNILMQKVINMVLQTSLGAPIPFPWFAPLFFLILFINTYSLIESIKEKSLKHMSVALGFTMIFTSVYLPYNVLYSFIAFSGALLIYFGLDKAKGFP